MRASSRSVAWISAAATVRRLVASALLVACSTSDPAAPVSAPVDGTWTAVAADYSSIRIQLTEQPDTYTLTGTWTGVRTSSTKVDSGIVFYGSRAGSHVAFGVTALNATRALNIDGTLVAADRISGAVRMTDPDGHTGPWNLTLSRQ